MKSMKTCSQSGCYKPAWAKGKCKSHSDRKFTIKKHSTLSRETTRNEEERKAHFEESKAQKKFFTHLWRTRPHKSELSQEYLGSVLNSMFMHHILPKSKYPDLRFEEENIILLTPEEHANVELNPTRYAEINQRREYLTNKFL